MQAEDAELLQRQGFHGLYNRVETSRTLAEQSLVQRQSGLINFRSRLLPHNSKPAPRYSQWIILFSTEPSARRYSYRRNYVQHCRSCISCWCNETSRLTLFPCGAPVGSLLDSLNLQDLMIARRILIALEIINRHAILHPLVNHLMYACDPI